MCQHVDLLGDADTSLHCDAVERHQIVQYGIGYVFKQRHQACGQAAVEYCRRNAVLEHRGREMNAQNRAVIVALEYCHKI